MKSKNWGVAAAIFVSFLCAGPARADADFTLINRTGYTISSVYVSSGIGASPGVDRLGPDVLQSGESVTINFPADTDCFQDLVVVFATNDRRAEWREVNLCELNSITVGYDSETRDLWARRD